MPRWFEVHLIPRIETIRSQRARLAAALFAFLLLTPVAALAQGSPFDTGFNAIQSLFTGTIAKVASLVAIVIGGYGFAHGEPLPTVDAGFKIRGPQKLPGIHRPRYLAAGRSLAVSFSSTRGTRCAFTRRSTAILRCSGN